MAFKGFREDGLLSVWILQNGIGDESSEVHAKLLCDAPQSEIRLVIAYAFLKCFPPGDWTVFACGVA